MASWAASARHLYSVVIDSPQRWSLPSRVWEMAVSDGDAGSMTLRLLAPGPLPLPEAGVASVGAFDFRWPRLIRSGFSLGCGEEWLASLRLVLLLTLDDGNEGPGEVLRTVGGGLGGPIGVLDVGAGAPCQLLGEGTHARVASSRLVA